MNKTTEALKLAEEALDIAANKPMWDGIKIRSALAAIREELSDHSGDDYENMTDDELADLQFTRAIAREALAQPVKQEPVAEHELIDIRCGCCGYMTYHREHMGCIKAAAPVRTKDLTDEEIWEAFETHSSDVIKAVRTVIAKDREKNNANNNS